jgi:hypothetical protein
LVTTQTLGVFTSHSYEEEPQFAHNIS